MSKRLPGPLMPLSRGGAGLLAICLSLFSVSCASNETLQGATRAPYNQTILIYFDGDKCPTGVNIFELNATRDNPPTQIRWKDAVLAADPAAGDPANFKIVFSPFDANPISSVNGATPNPSLILGDMPKVKFKYTVVGTECSDEAREHLDPYIRVL